MVVAGKLAHKLLGQKIADWREPGTNVLVTINESASEFVTPGETHFAHFSATTGCSEYVFTDGRAPMPELAPKKSNWDSSDVLVYT